MTEEYSFVINNVNSRSLCDISTRQSELQERRIIELYEAAEDIANRLVNAYDDMGVFEMLTFLSDGLAMPMSSIHNDALDDNLSILRNHLSSVGSLDKAVFTGLLLDRLKEKEIAVTEADFLSVTKFAESFTYVKNSLSDEAYDVFCETFKDPRLKYSKNLNEAAELVANEVVNYALLPLEEAGGERLHRTSQLIFKHDLKINSVTPVFGMDGSSDMKYALVSRGFSVPRVDKDDDLYLEVRASCATVSLSELLAAAEYFDCSVYRINTLCFNSDMNKEDYYSIVFKSNDKNFCGLLGYLTLFISSCTFVGMYKNLE